MDTWWHRHPIGDIAIPRLAFLRREGAIRVTASYTCPRGYEPDSSSAILSESDVGYKIKAFTSRIVCDGVYHDVSVTFRTTTTGDAFRARGQVYTQLTFGAAPTGAGLETRASNLTTVVLHT